MRKVLGSYVIKKNLLVEPSIIKTGEPHADYLDWILAKSSITAGPANRKASVPVGYFCSRNNW